MTMNNKRAVAVRKRGKPIMIITSKMVREADRKEFIKLLREESTWHSEEGAVWHMLVRAARDLEAAIGKPDTRTQDEKDYDLDRYSAR